MIKSLPAVIALLLSANQPINPEITLNDISYFLDEKNVGNFSTGIAPDGDELIIFTQPEHGTATAYIVGNEIWDLSYTGTDCFVGEDRFIYKHGNDYGEVIINVQSPTNIETPNYSNILYNTQLIESEYLVPNNPLISITKAPSHGVSTLINIANEQRHYSYDPVDDYVGNDYFEYTITETINGCSHSGTGRVDFEVNSITPVVSAPTEPQFRTLLASDNPKDNDQFGSGIAIEGDTVVVGVPGYQMDGTASRGEVIVYQKTDNEDEVIQHISNPDTVGIGRRFGQTIALKDGFLAVVAPVMATSGTSTTVSSNMTRVYVYKQEDDKSFTYVQSLDAVSNNSNSYFAYSNISINENYIVVGAKNETVDGTENVGVAYVYPRDGEGFGETPIELSDVNLTASGGFAQKVALMDDLVIVSMPNKQVYASEGDTQRYGAVYVYKDSGSGLEQVSVINSPQVVVDSYAYTANFGASLSVDDTMLAIGIPNATVDGLAEVGYVDTYRRIGDDFVLVNRITDADPVAGENFGRAVAIENPYLVVSNNATSNSNNTSKAETVQVYQYSGSDSDYTKLDDFEHVATYRTWVTFKEYAYFGVELDISDGTIISSSENAFNLSRLGSRSYRAGQVYLLEVDIQRPFWVNYRPSIIMSDTSNGFCASVSKPENSEYLTSGVGTDSAQMSYDMGCVSYGITGNYEECLMTCLEEAASEEAGEECYTMCEPAQLDFYNPTDANGDNKYEVDIKLTSDGQDFIYPLTWEVKDTMSFTEGHNDGLSYFHYNYYRLQLTGVGTPSYASELLFQDEKAYVRSSDSVYIYDKELSAPELLEDAGEVSLDDVISSGAINTSGVTTFHKTNLASFDVEDSRIATMTTRQTSRVDEDNEGFDRTTYETDSYIHLFEDTDYVESILVHGDSQNTYPCEDDAVCSVDHKMLNGVQLEHGMVFAAYTNQNYYHNDISAGYEMWTVETRNSESGVMIYNYDGTDYNLMQTIVVPASSENMSTVESFRADGNFLLINGSHPTDDYNEPNRYIRVYKFDGSSYSLLQSFNLPSGSGRTWKVSLENGYVLIENQRTGYTNLDTYIYQYDSNNNNFALIDTITNEEAGATSTDGFTGVHIQEDSVGDVYLYKRFYKRLEVRDATTDFVANAAYIGVFKQDVTTHKFRFLHSFTHRDGSSDFGTSFAIDGDMAISNSSSSGYLHSFKLVR